MFWQLVKLGEALRELHTLQIPGDADLITRFPIKGDNLVAKAIFNGGNVYINDTQYFGGIPAAVWNLYIGGEQPARKWLKVRSGKFMDIQDIIDYQKTIVLVSKTAEIMLKIRTVLI